jgi:hypothetical protein
VTASKLAPREAVTACRLAIGEAATAGDFAPSNSRTYELSHFRSTLPTPPSRSPRSQSLRSYRIARNSQTRTQPSSTTSQREVHRHLADPRPTLPYQSIDTSTHLKMSSSPPPANRITISFALQVSYSYVADLSTNSKKLYSSVEDLEPRQIEFRTERDIYYMCRSIVGAQTSLQHPL